jgi:hypothetical protein
MKYLFAFIDETTCSAFRRDLKKAGIAYETRAACEFPKGDQGPEIWVHDEDYDKAHRLLVVLQSER